MSENTTTSLRGGHLTVPRTRGLLSGFLLLVLGAWGALAPFFGPYFSFGFTPNSTWDWTQARGWFEVLPGGAAMLAGLLLMLSANRLVTSFGAWLGVAAGGWFVVGYQIASVLNLGHIGAPISTSRTDVLLQVIGLFSGLGAVIVMIAGIAVGRLSVRAVRDVKVAQRKAAEADYAAVRDERAASVDTGHGQHDDVPTATTGSSTDGNTPVAAADDAPAATSSSDTSAASGTAAASEADAGEQPGVHDADRPGRYHSEQIPVEEIERHQHA